jgi:hypothetical protein
VSYYSIYSTPRLTFVGLKAYKQKQSYSWRYIAAAVLLVATLVASMLAAQTLASARQTTTEQPAVTAAAQPPVEPDNQPAVTAVQDRSQGLKAELDAWIAAQKGSEWGFYVHSLDNDELEVGIDDTTQFQMASIYKLFLLKPLAQKLPAEAWATTAITERSYLDCVQAMLSVSDNPCAETIAGWLGWSAVHRQAQSDGYRQTVLNRADFLGGTAADTGLLLDRLYHGDGYGAKTRQISLDSLAKTKGSQAIRNACEGCSVYNKTGDLSGFKHDAAIVEIDGKTYAIVIFSKNSSWLKVTEAAALITRHL